jgi:hypothetical protein
MMYFKSVSVGLGTVLFGCVITPIAMVIWWISKSNAANKAEPAGPWGKAGGLFQPDGSGESPGAFPGFWVFILALFSAGFLASMYFLNRRRLYGLHRL